MIAKLTKQELLETLEKNRAGHRAIFEEAVAGYRRKMEALLDQAIARIREGSLERFAIGLPVPVDKTDEYDRAIAMVKMTSETIITLDEQEFGNLMLDKWEWSRDFFRTNSGYSMNADRQYKARGYDK